MLEHRGECGQQFPLTGDESHLLDFAYPAQPLIDSLRMWQCASMSGA